MESVIYDQTGKEIEKIDLPKSVFGLPWNAELVHQVVVSMSSNARLSTAHTKNRGEVSGTGKKPWKQKGTGRARHGSRRSPIWVGGGVSHGPRNEKDFSRKINKKMRVRSLFTVLSQKFTDKEILLVKNISIESQKTKDAKKIIDSLSRIKGFQGLTRRKNAFFMALAEKDTNVFKSFRNFGNLEIGQMKDVNPLDILKYKYLIIENPKMSFETLLSKVK